MDEARKEKPRPRDTEPAAMGREVRRGTILLFRLTEEMAMAEERDTAVSEEVMAITMELMIADNPVPAPVGAALLPHPTNVMDAIKVIVKMVAINLFFINKE